MNKLLTIDCGNTSRVSHTSKLGQIPSFPLLILATGRLKMMVYSRSSYTSGSTMCDDVPSIA